MKKVLSVLLIAVLALSVLVGCGGVSAKQKEMNEVYNLFGNRYGKAIECCAYNGVYNADDKELNAQFKAWAEQVKECGRTVDKAALLTNEEMDAVIAEMQALIPEFEALIAQYPIPETTAAE